MSARSERKKIRDFLTRNNITQSKLAKESGFPGLHKFLSGENDITLTRLDDVKAAMRRLKKATRQD